MTKDQILAFAVIAGMMVMFVWGRIRYDLVAGLALLAALLVGVVPFDQAFSGFSNDIIVIIGAALLVSAAVTRSRLMEGLLQALGPRISSVRAQLILLVTVVTVLSAFVKNIGALAMMLPVAFQMAKRSKVSPSVFLMPMAFGSLLGGLMTLIGTSPNIIVSELRQELVGKPFSMFDFAPVGVGLAILGIVFLAFAYKLLPQDRKGESSLAEGIDIQDYVTEGRVGPQSSFAGETLRALRKRLSKDVSVNAVVRDGEQKLASQDTVLREDDRVILEGEPAELDAAVKAAGLELEGDDREPIAEKSDAEIGTLEAVIGPGSLLIGKTAARLALHERFNVNMIAVSRSGERLTERLRDIRLYAGDVIVLQGPLTEMSDVLRDLGCLPLAPRQIHLGTVRRGLVPIAVLTVAMILAATGKLPVGIAFFAAGLAIILLGSLTVREAYTSIEWPLLVMIGALIPVSEAIRTTGGADVIATALANVAHSLPPWGTVALIMAAAMALTPFLNNAATVLVMAPIASSFAGQLGFSPDAFFMAVAVGAGCDFLTPIGHQCNLLVYGPGGYKFGDYARLGAPLSVLVLLVGTPLILLVWPLAK
ncbi:MAG TPA: SLC13 family permease [Steroidobacteraceae bacterium]|jgi:di/tricarboxylate transporter|nr:SLC13 family permease [Steroidobacteraceae bacterium]